MPLRQRPVDINVPNATAKPVTAILTVEPLDPRDLEGVDFEGCPLTARRFGLMRDLCGDPRQARPQKRLSVRLGPFEETTVRVLVETQEPPKGRRALAAFRVTDRCGKKVAGGVTVVCTSPPYGTSLPSAPDPANPCPLALAVPLYCVDPGTDPSKTLTPPGTIDPRHPRDLVAVIENTGPAPGPQRQRLPGARRHQRPRGDAARLAPRGHRAGRALLGHLARERRAGAGGAPRGDVRRAGRTARAGPAAGPVSRPRPGIGLKARPCAG